MATSSNTYAKGIHLPLPVSIGFVLLGWVIFTALFLLAPREPWNSLLAFIPGLMGIAALLAAGFTPDDCYLRLAPISKAGLAVLGAFLFFFILSSVPSGQWIGWNWLAALVYAPASGIAQELFFRASLLPALIKMFRGKIHLALVVHSGLFVLFHLRTFMVAPFWGDVGVCIFTFLGGMAWGWQVQCDRTVIWAMVSHSLALVFTSMFGWG